MIRLRSLTNLFGNEDGAFAIETAIVAPLLMLLSLGAFQTSMIVARQSELQGAMAEAEAIALATDPNTIEKRSTIQQVIMASTGLSQDKVTVTEAYRCANNTAYQMLKTACATGTVASSYVKIQITDTYNPTWTSFGIGGPLNFNQVRYVLYNQATVI